MLVCVYLAFTIHCEPLGRVPQGACCPWNLEPDSGVAHSGLIVNALDFSVQLDKDKYIHIESDPSSTAGHASLPIVMASQACLCWWLQGRKTVK